MQLLQLFQTDKYVRAYDGGGGCDEAAAVHTQSHTQCVKKRANLFFALC